jgi:hypothetical protein
MTLSEFILLVALVIALVGNVWWIDINHKLKQDVAREHAQSVSKEAQLHDLYANQMSRINHDIYTLLEDWLRTEYLRVPGLLEDRYFGIQMLHEAAQGKRSEEDSSLRETAWVRFQAYLKEHEL